MKNNSYKKRLSRDTWLEIALQLLAQDGPEALRIERLCVAAQKTKGSFYHHFADYNHFVNAMLELWHQKNTEDLIDSVEGNDNSSAQLSQLNQLAASLDHRLEIGIRRLAATDLTAKKKLKDVDEQRITYLTHLMQEAGIDKDLAEYFARIEYASFIGFQYLYPNALPEWLQAHGNLISEMIMAWRHSAKKRE